MYFKKAEIQDIPFIYDLMIQAFSEYATDEIPSSALKEQESTITSAFLNDNEEALIVYDGDAPLGMVRFKIQNYRLTFYRLSVIPHYQGQGISKALLGFLEKYTKNNGVSEITCKVRANVPKNISIYHSLDYITCDEYELNKPDNQKLKIVVMKKVI
ncbi:GNAT family N-acetyltransferase [Staphylococcus kloosii]|uniref:GNAT family N-acetyltransferase n=1 Tax=Staphylococcus kloosii TaxID=29384 RepID=UPI0028A36D48|nr:GNAT family N-acetyltransferase [Staphylococcus kloosii]MDT3959807.1 GNAT family N-acetyltransferase [Staphylococcus kloosii]